MALKFPQLSAYPTPANYLAFEEKGPGNGEDGQERGARGRKCGKG